jgi:hypothetical protein
MRYTKNMQNEKNGRIKFYPVPLKRVRLLLIAFVIVATQLLSGAGCAISGVSNLEPPACPRWNEDAIRNLEMLLDLQTIGEIDIIDLEYQLGEQQRHCEALDAYLKKDDCED